MMANIGSINTKPEITVRKLLHERGFRFRLHDRYLPGRPDVVLKRYRAAIFVHGCFWHLHTCHLFKWPSTRPEFWRKKINHNVQKDRESIQALNNSGWRVAVVWECSLKGRTADAHEVQDFLTAWLYSDRTYDEVGG